MRTPRGLLLAVVVFAVTSSNAGQTGKAPVGNDAAASAHATHEISRPQALQWTPMTLRGAQMAVVHGDPSKAGELYVVRIRAASGTKIPPHWHPNDEQITVLRGKLLLGRGETFDLSKAEELPAGTYAFMPKEVRHFGSCKGHTEYQLHGVGPFVVNWVNPADVPGASK